MTEKGACKSVHTALDFFGDSTTSTTTTETEDRSHKLGKRKLREEAAPDSSSESDEASETERGGDEEADLELLAGLKKSECGVKSRRKEKRKKRKKMDKETKEVLQRQEVCYC